MTKENKLRLERKLFVLGVGCMGMFADDIKFLIGDYCEKSGDKIRVDIYIEKGLEKLPEDYDIYLLHLRDIDNLDQLEIIKQEQPWSKIFAVSGAFIEDMPKNYLGFIDKFFSPFNGKEDLEYLINSLKE